MFRVIELLVHRLRTIGIEIEFIANYPWVYLDSVNGVKVTGTHMARHGFTSFMISGANDKYIFYSEETFKKIREMIRKDVPNG